MTAQQLRANYYEQNLKNLAAYIEKGAMGLFGADHRNEYDFATLIVADGVGSGKSDAEIAQALREAGLQERQISLVVEQGLETQEGEFYAY